MNYTPVKHCFGSMGETTQAIVRKYNSYDLPKETVDELMKEFNKLNADKFPVKLGSVMLIPVLDEFIERHADKLKNQ